MKNIILLGGLVVGAVLMFFSYAQESILTRILLAVLAGLSVYASSYKKLDFNDVNLYIFALCAVVLTFAMRELFISPTPNANLLLYLGAYLLGSVPFGFLLAKFFAKVDIKEAGSKSIGATNVLRVVKENNAKLAKKLAVATFACDFLKAALPILALKLAAYDDNMLYSIGVFAVLGHCFSAYLSLEGGKGVATAAGVMAVLLPLELIIGLVAWFVVGKIFKISSLASLAGLVAFLIAAFTIHYEMSINTHAPVLVICFIIVYKHIPNIKRLIFKKECKVV